MALGNIIETSDYATTFIGRLNIDLGTSTSGRSVHMTNLITQYQPDILRDLLGETLYNDLYNNSTDDKWQKFIDGETIDIDNDQKFNWVGAKAMLSYFIYYYFKDDAESLDTETGQKQANNENSSSAIMDLNKKISRVYNIAIDYYNDGYKYLNYKNDEVADTFEDIDFTKRDKINPFGI